MALIVLLLSVQPVCAVRPHEPAAACCADDCGAAEKEERREDADCKACNPFQSCACCVAAVVTPATATLWPAPQPDLPTAAGAERPSPLLQTPGSDFWQPPRRS